ncbi:MAG: hypothetical protein KGI51_05955 [Rhodospirillales bacterium]|nr:hypothetical protein [Rhodospirillales bacterium]
MTRGLVTSLMLGLSLAAAPLAWAAGHHAAKLALPGYKTEAQAKTACGVGGVVWRARHSHYFHLPKSRYFGKTRGGAFVCQTAAEAKGLRAAKS